MTAGIKVVNGLILPDSFKNLVIILL